MNRRSFLTGLAAALVMPEPRRVYSFMPGLWAPPEIEITAIGGGNYSAAQANMAQIRAQLDERIAFWRGQGIIDAIRFPPFKLVSCGFER